MPATTRAARAQHGNPFNFLELPGELRCMVYDSLAKPTRVVYKVPESQCDETPSVTRTLVFTLGRRCERQPFRERHREFVAHSTAVISLLSVNRQVYCELNAELNALRVQHDFEIMPDYFVRSNACSSTEIWGQLPLPSVWNLRLIVLPVHSFEKERHLYDFGANLLHLLRQMRQLEALDLSLTRPEGEIDWDKLGNWSLYRLRANEAMDNSQIVDDAGIDALWEQFTGSDTPEQDTRPNLLLPNSLRRFHLTINGKRLLTVRKIVKKLQHGLQESRVEWVDTPCDCIGRSQLCPPCTSKGRT